MNNEILHKEIDLIQGCINRMANNSFLLKGWIISLVAIVLAIKKEEIGFLHQGFIFIPIVAFWYLDAYFLRLERLYRKLYGWTIENRVMNNSENLYNLDYRRFSTECDCIIFVMFSRTLLFFYFGLILALVFLFIK